jgi:hypothetical protein
MQYPAQRGLTFSTTALQFMDGSEQRFCNYPSALRRWVVQLNMLDQSELQQLQEFVRELFGSAGTFAFTDPRDGTSYPSCSLASDSATVVLVSEWDGRVSLTIVENQS